MAKWIGLYLLAAFAGGLPVVPALVAGAIAMCVGFNLMGSAAAKHRALGLFLISCAPIATAIEASDSVATFVQAWWAALVHDKLLAFAAAFVILMETYRSISGSALTVPPGRKDATPMGEARDRAGPGSDIYTNSG